MPLQASVHVKDGNVTGAYASQAKNVGYDNTNVEAALDSIMPRTATGTTLAQLVTAIGKLSEEQKSRCTIKIGENIIRQYYRDSSGTEAYHYTQTGHNGRCYEVRLLIQPSSYIYKEYEVNGTSKLLDKDISVTSWTIYYQGTPID